MREIAEQRKQGGAAAGAGGAGAGARTGGAGSGTVMTNNPIAGTSPVATDGKPKPAAGTASSAV